MQPWKPAATQVSLLLCTHLPTCLLRLLLSPSSAFSCSVHVIKHMQAAAAMQVRSATSPLASIVASVSVLYLCIPQLSMLCPVCLYLLNANTSLAACAPGCNLLLQQPSYKDRQDRCSQHAIAAGLMEDGAQSITMKILFAAGDYPGKAATLHGATLPVA